MARFSNKIESLRYADRQHKTIEILYKNGESINSYYIEVDYNNQDFLDLLKEYSIEDIEDQTRIYYENINMRRESEVLNRATEMFESWIKLAQIDLDRQDEERYKIFEKYKKSLPQVEESYKKHIDGYDYFSSISISDEHPKYYQVYKKEKINIYKLDNFVINPGFFLFFIRHFYSKIRIINVSTCFCFRSLERSFYFNNFRYINRCSFNFIYN